MPRRQARGQMLDHLCDDKVFYVERGNGGFLVVDACNDAYFRKLSPVELIELGIELIQAGAEAIKG
jgi:hypothetical protein